MGNSKENKFPAVFSSVEEAVRILKLDKRHRWEESDGELIRWHKYTSITNVNNFIKINLRGIK